MRSRTSRVGAAGATVALAVGILVVPGTAAQAGVDCGALTGCSHVINRDDLSITARHNWSGGGTTGTAITDASRISGATRTLYAGQETPRTEDWDVLQVDSGWCYKVELYNWYGKRWTMRYDARGTGNKYVKVENDSYATVLDQSTTGCP